MVVQCDNCGAKFNLKFSEDEEFIWVCDKCMKRFKHVPPIHSEDEVVKDSEEIDEEDQAWQEMKDEME